MPLGQERFALTSNRDESPLRSPAELSFDREKGLLYPRDTLAGGTWICASDQNRLICLLNGAFVKHKHLPPYRKSRGLIVLEFMESDDIEHTLESYNLDQIEPFTMVIWDDGQLWEFRWDGMNRHPLQLDKNDCHLWSSSTLYDATMQEERKNWFHSWQKMYPQPGTEQIRYFHLFAGKGDPVCDTLMNRNEIVKTLSLTQVTIDKTEMFMTYRLLLNNTIGGY
jgi:uncharacterized protein with NRDE domain